MKTEEKKNKTKSSYIVNYGYYWDMFEDCFSIGEVLVKYLFDNNVIAGNTFVECLDSEYGLPLINHEEELTDDMEFKIYDINIPEIKKLKDYYLSLKCIKEMEKYDNIVFAIDDYPAYSNSNRNFCTSNILILNKTKSFFIDLVYKKNKYKVSVEEIKDISKKLILKKCL